MKQSEFPNLDQRPIGNVAYLIRRSCRICVAHTVQRKYSGSFAAKHDECWSVKQEIKHLLVFFMRKGAFYHFDQTLQQTVAIGGGWPLWILTIRCYTNDKVLLIKTDIRFSYNSARQWLVT